MLEWSEIQRECAGATIERRSASTPTLCAFSCLQVVMPRLLFDGQITFLPALCPAFLARFPRKWVPIRKWDTTTQGSKLTFFLGSTGAPKLKS